MIRMICGVLAPTSGTISFNKIDVSHEDYRDALGYLPQEFGYYPEFSALDFSLYIAALKGLPKPQAKEKAWELLEQVSLKKDARKRIKTFSGPTPLFYYYKLIIYTQPMKDFIHTLFNPGYSGFRLLCSIKIKNIAPLTPRR